MDVGARAAGCCSGGGGGVASSRAEMSAWETLPAKWVAYFFLVEIAGKRDAILFLVGCQRVHDFGPEKVGTGEAGLGKRPGSPVKVGCQRRP